MSSWFILRDSKEHGPFSASHLKEMAKSGGLVKSDKIRRSDMQKTMMAGAVKGLFEIKADLVNDLDQIKNQNSLIGEGNNKSEEKADTNSGKWAWKNWTLKGKITLGASLSIFVILGLWSNVQLRKEAKEKFANAEAAWTSGDKKTAYDIYEPYIFEKFNYVEDDKKEIAIARSMEYCAIKNDTDKFEKIKLFADKEGIKVVSNNNVVNSLLAAIIARDNAPQQAKIPINNPAMINQNQPQLSPKVDALVRFITTIKQLDPYLTKSERSEINNKLNEILKEFKAIPVDPNNEKNEVKSLAQLRDKELNKYKGQIVIEMDEQISIIVDKYLRK